jgi:flagellin-like protein
MGLFDTRRAITPLVATILLVAFSVGLGALVMSWGEDYIEAKAEFVQGTAEVKSGCDAAHIDIIKIGGQPQACFGPDTIQVWIDNGPNTDLYNIHARIAGANGVDVKEEILMEPLLKANAAKATIPYNRALGQILQIKLTPKIWTGREVAICSQSAITVERIPAC